MDNFWRKAGNAADGARLLFAAGNYDGACNRAYYAMFNAARALLVRRGVRPRDMKTHATVLRLFSLHFVKEGFFEAAAGKWLAQAGRTRTEADYSTNDVELQAAQQLMHSLERFMATAEEVLLTGGPQGGADD